MRRFVAPVRVCLALGAVVLLAGCVSLPAGPSLQALPGSRTSGEQFAADDVQCLALAKAQAGGRTPADAANDSAVASAAAGTAIGAAVGGLIDGSSGAATGAGMGLLFGALAGAGASRDAYWITQRRFDQAYYACMYARGHKVPVPAHAVGAYRARYEAAARGAVAPVPPPPPGWNPPPAAAPR